MTGATTARRLLAGLAAAAALAWGGAATAATCGITGSATASGGTYDPFSPTGFPTATVALRLQRVNGAGGQKTDIVNFFLKSNSTAADGTSIIPTSVIVEGNVAGTESIFSTISTNRHPSMLPHRSSPRPPTNSSRSPLPATMPRPTLQLLTSR